MKKLVLGTVVAGALFVAAAHAHHSAAMFDDKKEVVLQGTVKSVEITNPHSWIQLVVTAPAGTSTEWSVEMASPGILIRQGFKRSSIKVADKLTVKIHPLRDGRPGGVLVSLTTDAGEVLPRAAAPSA